MANYSTFCFSLITANCICVSLFLVFTHGGVLEITEVMVFFLPMPPPPCQVGDIVKFGRHSVPHGVVGSAELLDPGRVFLSNRVSFE